LMTEGALFILFLLGIIMSLKFLLYFDILIKDKKKVFDPNIFSVLALLLISLFYMFWIKETQDRWVFLWMPFIFFLSAKPLMLAYSYFKKNNRVLIIAVILALLLFIGYKGLVHVNSLVIAKLDSYSPVKDAGIWLKENSNPDDVIFSRSLPQIAYYSQRRTYSFGSTGTNYSSEEGIDQLVAMYGPRYVMVSIFEPHPQFLSDWVQHHQENLTVVQAYTDSSQQPVLIIYKTNF
jgi:hypothetical protein